MNRISVTEQPSLKTKDILIEVGEQEPPIILLADMALIFMQQHNLESFQWNEPYPPT